MKKPTLVYIPLIILFVFALSVLVVHYKALFVNYNMASMVSRLPFTLENGAVSGMRPEAESAGLKISDRLFAINGRKITGDEIYLEEIAKLQSNQPFTLTVSRKTSDGKTETKDINLKAVEINDKVNFVSRMAIGFLYTYALPTISILLGFWVVFIRPRDYLAWLLLFVLLGISSVSFENYASNTLAGVFNDIFFSTWSLSMMLFGIYFPERWSVDKRVPWAKWILIVPLIFQLSLTSLTMLKTFFGLNLISYVVPLARPYGKIAMPLNMLAIGIFFLALGHKSGTLTNPDARRRIKLMVYGTSIAMMPMLLIILYRFITGARGSFFDIVPFWIAIISLMVLVLFPLTMAYVIVVHKAMDVSVVIRQGLQYALAKNGIRVIQVLLICGVLFGLVRFVQNTRETNLGVVLFLAIGVGAFFLIGKLGDKIRTWIDRKFFREAYDAEQILSELSENVRSIIETKPLLETVAQKVSESLHVSKIALMLKNGNSYQPAFALGYDAPPPVSITEKANTVERLKRNEPLVVYSDDPESWINIESNLDGDKELLTQLDSQLLLPMNVKDGLRGFISLGPKRSEEPYSPNDLRLLKSVAAQTGLALENSRLTEAIAHETAQRERLNREVEIAREVQERLFPQCFPEISGLDFCGACRPALGVGGDYYDFLQLPNGHLGIAIGDVSGKGISAALLMASLQASLRGQAMQSTNDLASLMGNVNKLVYDASAENRYATFFYAQYEPESHILTYVNAGHNPPMIFRKAGDEIKVIRLETGGPVVGLLPLFPYSQDTIILESGDLFVGFTDGISESMNSQEEEWGEEKMMEAIKKMYGADSNEMLHYLVEHADKFAAGAKQHDDMTLVVVRVI